MEGNNNRQIHFTSATIAFIVLAALVLVSLAITINTNNRINASEPIVQEMHDTISKMADAIPASTSATDTTEVSENSSVSNEPVSYTQEDLIKMLTSGKFEDLLTVATYPEATETQLLFIATFCTRSDLDSDETSVVQLASALIDHPNATTSVMSTLARCKSPIVWTLVAQSEQCSETTLTILAENCMSELGSSDIKNSLSTSVAIAVIENPAVTEQIIDMLEHSSNGYVKYILEIRSGRITG